MRKRLIILLLFCLVVVSCGDGDGAGETVPELVPFSEMVGDPVAGKAAYESTCFACHGMDATGMENSGKDLTTSPFVKGLTDEQLVTFIIDGRSIHDPANTSGVDMPPRGGNPSLSDQDLFDIVAYLRTLEQ